MPLALVCRLSTFWVCSKWGFSWSWCCTSRIHLRFTSSISVFIRGPDSFCLPLQFRMNLVAQASTCKAWCKSCFSRSWSTRSVDSSVWQALSTSQITFTSSSETADAEVTGLGGQFSLFASHSGPFHHRLVVPPPLLATSAWLSCVGTYLHSISGCWQIFSTQLVTNCLYCPLPRIQCNATVLSNQT